MSWPVLIARPGARAEALVAALAAKGHACESLDIMTLTPVAPSAALTATCLGQPPDWLIFISPMAASRWLEEARAQLGAGMKAWHNTVRLAATGQSTAEVIHEALGVMPITPESAMHSASEGLLALPALAVVDAQHVVLVSGEGGRPVLRETLSARGAFVTSLPLYRRCLRPPVAAARERLAQGAFAALIITSAEQLNYLGTWYSKETLRRPLIVSSERLAECAHPLGFTCIEMAADATPQALADATAAVIARQTP